MALKIFLIAIVFHSTASFGQINNKIFFEISSIVSMPKTRSLVLKNDPLYPPIVSYTLNTTFLPAAGLRLALGYNVPLTEYSNSKIYLPILLNFKRVVERMDQTGSYSTGHFNYHYYRGKREVNLAMNVVAVTLGLNYMLKDKNGHAWGFDLLFSENINFSTKMTRHETADQSCINCKGLGNTAYEDLQLFHSADLRLFRSFSMKDNVLSPFVGYNFNYYYNLKKENYYTPLNTFDNPAYNLNFYHFVEIGLRMNL